MNIFVAYKLHKNYFLLQIIKIMGVKVANKFDDSALRC